jgi:hypothetical protein
MNRGMFGHIPGAGSRWTTLALLVIVWAPLARAQVVDATSTTMLRLKPDWRAGDTRTGFWGTEMVGLSVRGIEVSGVDDLNIQLSAWGQLSSLKDSIYSDTTGDIDLLYIQGSLFKRRLSLTLGRQLISGGAARVLQIDGVNATVAIAKGFGITAYAGAPTVSRFNYPVGEFAFGGRAFWRPSYGSEVGVSFLEIISGSVLSRQDLGLDGRYTILPNLWASASGILSLQESRFSDAGLEVHWQIIPTVEAFVKGQHYSPDLFLPMTSIFSVFAETNRDAVGGGVFWQALPRLGLYGEYNRLWVDGGHGDEAELRATYRLTRKSTVGVNARFLFVPVNGVTDLRAWVSYALTQTIRLTADLEGTILSNPVNAKTGSVVGTGGATWMIGSGWSAMLSGSVGVTPFFENLYTLTARIGYNFSTYENKGAAK